MKKKFLYVTTLIALLLFTSGCVKFNGSIEIKKDKSMDFSLIYAFDKSLYDNNDNMITEENKKKIEDSGFKLEDYSDDKFKGIKISREIANIDKVSSKDDITFNLNDLDNLDSNNIHLFKIKKGFFKNTYSADIKLNTSDTDFSSLIPNGSSAEDESFDDILETDDTDTIDFEVNKNNDYKLLNLTKQNDLSALESLSSLNNMDLSFEVKLPYKAKSHNASSALDNEKNLKWTFTANSKDDLKFEFELYNMFNLYLAIGLAVFIIGVLVFIIFYTKKNKKA